MEVKLSLVIVTCRRTADLLTRPLIKILVFLLPYMTQWAFLGNEGHRARQINNCMLVILDWLPVQSSNVFFSPAILSLVSTDCILKLWTEILKLIVSIVFVRHLMGFLRKVFFLLYWGRNVAATKSASLFNGKFRYFAKVLPKIDACFWYLTRRNSSELVLK